MVRPLTFRIGARVLIRTIDATLAVVIAIVVVIAVVIVRGHFGSSVHEIGVDCFPSHPWRRGSGGAP
eukprot:905377-Lingulodinium_polyedra.AAC.1